jgi:hypothetical protein
MERFPAHVCWWMRTGNVLCLGDVALLTLIELLPPRSRPTARRLAALTLELSTRRKKPAPAASSPFSFFWSTRAHPVQSLYKWGH